MKRSLTAILAGGAVFGATVAFAATLGVNGNNLGAGASDTITACDSDVDVDYTVAFAATEFEVTQATVYNIDDSQCDGEFVQLAVFDGADWTESEDNHQVADGTSLTFDLPAGLTAEDIVNVAVTIYDGDGADDAA